MKVFPLEKYMKKLAPFTGAFIIIAGAVMCFAGSRFLPLAISFLVGFGVTGVCSLVGYNFLDPDNAKMWHLIVLVIASLAFGVVAAIFAFKFVENWGVTILAFWVGILLALMALKLAQVQNQNITLGACAVGGILGACIGNKYKAGIKKFGTAIIGGFLLIRGIAVYAGHFPSEFGQSQKLSEDEAKILEEPDSASTLYWTIGYLVAFVVISFAGAVFQFKMFREKD